MGKPIRVGLIGLGRAGYGMHRIELGRRPDKFQFVAVCDEIEERTKAFADEFGSRTYTSVEDLIADPEVEMVTVATRSCDHYRHAVMVLEAGEHATSKINKIAVKAVCLKTSLNFILCQYSDDGLSVGKVLCRVFFCELDKKIMHLSIGEHFARMYGHSLCECERHGFLPMLLCGTSHILHLVNDLQQGFYGIGLS